MPYSLMRCEFAVLDLRAHECSQMPSKSPGAWSRSPQDRAGYARRTPRALRYRALRCGRRTSTERRVVGDGASIRARVGGCHRPAHRSREVRLLKPLVNWKYGLTTLERVRRYAVEFSVSSEEEAEVWRVFEAQDAELRAGLVER